MIPVWNIYLFSFSGVPACHRKDICSLPLYAQDSDLNLTGYLNTFDRCWYDCLSDLILRFWRAGEAVTAAARRRDWAVEVSSCWTPTWRTSGWSGARPTPAGCSPRPPRGSCSTSTWGPASTTTRASSTAPLTLAKPLSAVPSPTRSSPTPSC